MTTIETVVIARGKMRGLTLIELMVVVAIMAVIAAIAYPAYTNQVQKSRRADAKAALQSIALAQERYYTREGKYTALLTDLVDLSAAIRGGNSDKGYYTIAPPALPEGNNQQFSVTATATGAQADDTDCATFTIDYLGNTDSTGGGTNCW